VKSVERTGQAAGGGSALRRRVLVIYNPTAGIGSAKRLGRVLKVLLAMGAVVTVRRTAGRGDAEAFALEASASLYDVLAVAGGDGTINEVVNGLAGKTLPLAVIPLGTANVLAAEIDVPRNARDLAQMILTGKSRAVCVGVANGRYFIMMAGAGFDAHLVAGVNPRVKRLLGKLTYVLGGMHGMFRFASPPYRVTIDGASYTATSVIIANGHYYGGRFICAPCACLDDESFEVCLFLSAGRLAVLRYGLALVLGRLGRLPDFRIVRGTEVRIEHFGGGPDRPSGAECRPAEPVQLDGDIGCCLPLTIRPAAQSLLLICGGGTQER
jgi:diacylglycerol kinase (ATP)